MIPAKWRLANRGDASSGEEASTRDMDLRTFLKASTAHIAPSASLRTQMLSSFDQRSCDRRFSLKSLVGVTAILIAVVLTGAVLRVVNSARRPSNNSSVMTVSPSVPQATTPQLASVPFSPVDKVHRKKHSFRKPQSEIIRSRQEVESTGGFNSLLYCDSFTCGDSMQLVRVQLPAATLGPAYRPLARNGYLTAELIVGSDGVTRALRIEK